MNNNIIPYKKSKGWIYVLPPFLLNMEFKWLSRYMASYK